MNLYGYANGDPVNFSDPFGLCAEEQQNKRGRCPGGLTVSEWSKVEEAAKHLPEEDRERILQLLADGKIRGANLRPNHSAEARRGGVIVINRRTGRMFSSFDRAPRSLALTLAHELHHLDQFASGTLSDRLLWHLRYGFNKQFADSVEAEADSVARSKVP